MKNVIIGLLVLIILFLGFKIKMCNNVETKVVTKTKLIETITVDTVLKVVESVPIPNPTETIRYKTVMVEVESDPIHDTIYIQEPKEIFAKIPIRLYRDSIDLQDFRLFYEHEIAGTLEDSKYSFEYFKETKTKEIETTIETTERKKQILSMYAVGGYQFPNEQYNVGADLVMRKIKLGYRFGLDKDLNQSHTVEVGLQLFSL